MSCTKENLMMLHAYLDGELDAANTVRFETHLDTCTSCRAELAQQKDIRRAIRGPGVAYAAPDALRRRIEAAIGVTGAAAEPVPPPKAARANWWMTGVSMA